MFARTYYRLPAIIAFLTPLLLSSPASASGTYAQVQKDTERFAREFPRLVSRTHYGLSVRGRPLTALLIREPKLFTSSRPTLILTAGVHGDEYLGIEHRLVPELFRHPLYKLSAQKFLKKGGAILFVPLVNPDGAINSDRYNADGADLNRDWNVREANFVAFRQPESQALAKFLKKLHAKEALDYRTAVDYHCCGNYLLTPWSHKKDLITKKYAESFERIGQLAKSHFGLKVGATGRLLGYFPLGTLKDFFFSKYRTTSFTFEGLPLNQEKGRFSQHLAWLADVLDELSAQAERNTVFPLVATSPIQPLLPSE